MEHYYNESRVSLVIKKGGTIAAVRNFGVRYAKGEVIAFLDGDCVPSHRGLYCGVDLLTSDANIGCVGFIGAGPRPDASWVERAWQHISSTSKGKGTIDVPWLSSFNLIPERQSSRLSSHSYNRLI